MLRRKGKTIDLQAGIIAGRIVNIQSMDEARETVILRIQLFGQMNVSFPDGREMGLHSRKTRALLAILAITSPQPVTRTEIAALLWSQRGREQAYASLRQSIHLLTETLHTIRPGLLRVGRTHLTLETTAISVDTAIVVATSGARPQGLALYRSGLLDDLAGLDPAFDRWRLNNLDRLKCLARARAEDALAALAAERSLETTNDSDAAAPDYLDAVISAAEQLIDIDCGHEGAWQALIRAYVMRGDRASAVGAFERCRHALADIARLTPGRETLDLIAGMRGTLSAGLPTAEAAVPRKRRLERSTMSGRLCVGVMPLRYLDSTRQDELLLGLGEEITTALARVMWISCVAPTTLASTARILHQDEAWLELGVDFLLEVSLQPSGGQIRVTARLLDLHAGRQIVWARRFDREEKDILSLQDEIAAGIVAQLDPELLMLEGERAQHRARQREKDEADAGSSPSNGRAVSNNPSAEDLLLQAIPSIHRLERTAFRSAGTLLAAAVALDPSSVSAHAWYGYWYLFQVGQGWSEDTQRDTAAGGHLAARAVALNSGDARALTISGHVRGFLMGKPDEALFLHERALAVNPHLALAWCFSGLALSYLGRHEEAILRTDTAKRLAPFDPHGFFFEMAACLPQLLLGHYERAVEVSKRSVALNASFSSAYKMQLSALGHLGRFDEAAGIREHLLLIEPRLTVEDAIARSPLKIPADVAHYAEGLRKGGLE